MSLPPARSPRRPRRAVRLLLEALEDRTVPASFVVSNTNDTGAGLLRQAILDANALSGADVITFGITGTIDVASNDANFAFGPTGFVITDDLTIQGPTTGTGVTLDGQGQRRLFGVVAGSSLALYDLTLAGGTSRGGGRRNDHRRRRRRRRRRWPGRGHLQQRRADHRQQYAAQQPRSGRGRRNH